MFAKKLLVFITMLAVTTMACGFTVNLPITTDIKTGSTVTDDILVPDPDPDAEFVEVEIAFGAGELFIDPGAEALVEGSAVFNVEDFRPEVETTGSKVELSTGNLEIEGFPNFNNQIENTWKLQLSDRPLDLKIMAGAYMGEFELGGLALRNLHITDGAADVTVNFDDLNKIVLDTFRYDTGASNVMLKNLGNANFRSMRFQGGAGNYELDFSGDLQDDATVSIDTGLSSLTVFVPANLNVRVRIDSGLTNISTQGSWAQSGGTYTHDGDGPTLEIKIDMGAGNLILQTQ